MFLSKYFRWCLGLAIFLVLAISANSFTPLQAQGTLENLEHYVAVTAQIHTCGSIDENDLKAGRAAGIETVISLSTESPSKIRLHKQTATSIGLNYVHIPVSWKKPTISSLERFFDAMDAHKTAKVLVHCRLNWRASAYTYLYRRIRKGVPHAEAKEAMRAVWNPERDRVWSAFIDSALQHFERK